MLKQQKNNNGYVTMRTVDRKFRIGLPNRGRLSGLCREIFVNNLQLLGEEALTSRCYHFATNDGSAEIIFVRSDDIPRLVAEGHLDAGITGQDYVLESKLPLTELIDLNLCYGDVSVLVPDNSPITSVSELDGKVIATQLPVIAQAWLNEKQLTNATIMRNTGANEVYPFLGLADATIDVVSSGETARANNMKTLDVILPSSGRLFTSKAGLEANKAALDHLVERLKKEYLQVQ